MKEEVMVCVKAKTDFFGQYFTIPAQHEDEYRRFVEDTYDLGERSVSAAQFESDYISSGLSDRFNSLVSKCVPKARKMTDAERRESARLAKEMNLGTSEKGGVAKGIAGLAADEAMDYAKTEGRSILRRVSRKAMIESGTFRDYTVASNRLDTVKKAGGFLKRRLGKKHEEEEE